MILNKYFILTILVSAFLISAAANAQIDTVKYQWPVAPLNVSHGINGTFCEFRNTLSSDHFHNAVDIGEPDGNPVYACMNGIVHSIVSSGSNSYVRVRSNVNGQWKHITYLHIIPNPALVLGQSVTVGTSVLGSIYPGMGHVHLIERELVSSASSNGVEINNLRENGGLTPYIDTFPPVIHRNTLEFRLNGTSTQIPANGLTSKIDIVIKIEEWNGPSSVHRNNGTYMAGYRVWSSDTSALVYEPDDSGLKYMFNLKPNNSDVGRVFVQGTATLSNPVYYITNGRGASFINAAHTVSDNFFDTGLVDEGGYILEIFSEDTRNNFVNEYFPITITRNDIVPPSIPVLMSVLNTDDKKGLQVSWKNNTEPDLIGYRLYYTDSGQLTDWLLAADENILQKTESVHTFNSPQDFITPTTDDVYFFYITAVDSNGNESGASDIYSRSSYVDGSLYKKALIVDGFDRYGGSGSWQNPTHSFNTLYFIALTVSDSIVISSCANDAIIDDLIDLNDYDLVFWFLGDESTADKTFNAAEQLRCATYMQKGGRFFTSGSEIGWDLDRSHSSTLPSDTLFYRHYLKARFMDDGNSLMNIAVGVDGSFFEGSSFNFGITYPEDYPDDIDPNNGSFTVLNYNQQRNSTTPRKASVAYTGTFGDSTNIGKMIYVAFPFETIFSFSQRIDFMTKVLQFFDTTVNVEEDDDQSLPGEYSLSQNYPNPFNPSTTIKFEIVLTGKVSLKVYDVLGREVQTLVNEIKSPGKYKVIWNAGSFASGVYFFRLQAGNFSDTKRMILLK